MTYLGGGVYGVRPWSPKIRVRSVWGRSGPSAHLPLQDSEYWSTDKRAEVICKQIYRRYLARIQENGDLKQMWKQMNTDAKMQWHS